VKWMRTIDSAQRVVGVTPGIVGAPRVQFHIQGVDIDEGGSVRRESFAEMAERGIAEEREPALTLWQRLLRKEARVGVIDFADPSRVRMTLWTRPRLTLDFALDGDEGAELFRECEIMVLSAGFHFRTVGVTERVYKG